jgi:hypothetical protein
VPRFLTTALLTCVAALSPAAEVHIQFTALERLLAQQMFTDEGRRYVRGSRDAKCSFAWLENPRVTGENGKLAIRARFTGRSALDLFGRCIGLGDSFDLKITALPYFDKGFIALRDVAAAPEAHDGFYAKQVCSSISWSLSREFRYPLAAEAKRALEDPGAQTAFPRELRRFYVSRMYVTKDALAVEVDFEVLVK